MASQPQKKDDEVIGKCLDCFVSYHTKKQVKKILLWCIEQFFSEPFNLQDLMLILPSSCYLYPSEFGVSLRKQLQPDKIEYPHDLLAG